jgi:hypothetical protein
VSGAEAFLARVTSALDRAYIERWLDDLGIRELWQGVQTAR